MSNSEQAESINMDIVYNWIVNICNKDTRLLAMRELFDHRDCIENLAVLLWEATGVLTSLLTEVLAIYPAVDKNELTSWQSQCVCLSLAMLETIASHPKTAIQLMQTHTLAYILPLLKITQQSIAAEKFRMTVLRIFCGMVSLQNTDIMRYFLGTELMPLVLRILELESHGCKALAGYILERVLENEVGLKFVCRQEGRLAHVLYTMERVMYQLTLSSDSQGEILKYMVRGYSHLSENRLAKLLLKKTLPEELCNGYFSNQKLNGYEEANEEINELLYILNMPVQPSEGIPVDEQTGE